MVPQGQYLNLKETLEGICMKLIVVCTPLRTTACIHAHLNTAETNCTHIVMCALKLVQCNEHVFCFFFNRHWKRREKVAVETRKDMLVWSNDHVIQWVESLGLADFATSPEFMVGSLLWTVTWQAWSSTTNTHGMHWGEYYNFSTVILLNIRILYRGIWLPPPPLSGTSTGYDNIHVHTTSYGPLYLSLSLSLSLSLRWSFWLQDSHSKRICYIVPLHWPTRSSCCHGNTYPYN